jgi:acetyl-CoA carboxylase carboxyl transferase subunit beta
VFRKQVEQNLNVCPECGHHFYVPTAMRIRQLLDPDSFEEWYPDMTSGDPLGFSDRKPYRERVIDEQKKTGMKDACTVGRGYMRGRPLVFGLTDSAFIMGSMGSVVGEKLTRAVERATELSLPLVIVSGSGGGARMHEGIISLMQMGKVSAALARYRRARGLFISVLTNPTMGGVAASFASLGDIIVAEPKALVGFAGPRVVEATCKIALPDDFQTSEFMLKHGFVDRIVARSELRSELARLIDYGGRQ